MLKANRLDSLKAKLVVNHLVLSNAEALVVGFSQLDKARYFDIGYIVISAVRGFHLDEVR